MKDLHPIFIEANPGMIEIGLRAGMPKPALKRRQKQLDKVILSIFKLDKAA